MKKIAALFSLIFLTSCTPSSLSEYRAEGEGEIKKLIEELSQVETLAQLESKQMKLKRRFSEIAELMIAAKKFQVKHPDELDEVTTWQIEVSNVLKQELLRVYQIEGCSNLLEEIQRDTLHRLDLIENHKNY